MSIIHEARKKAASEGVSETPKSASRDALLKVSKGIPRGYRWIVIILSLLILSGISFSVRYLLPIVSARLDKSAVPPALPLLDRNIHSELSPPDGHLLTTEDRTENSSNGEVLRAPHAEEGERVLTAGIELYNNGKIDEASRAFQKTVELLPSSPVAHNNLGLVLRHQEKINEALAHYQEALRLDPNYAEAENNIGLIYDQAGSIDEAAIHYKRAIDINPAIPAFHLNYATLLERKGDFSSARKEYQVYLSLEKDHLSEIIPIVRSHIDKLKGL